MNFARSLCKSRGNTLLAKRFVTFDASKVKVISLDVTGTLVLHKEAVAKTYADCIQWAGIHPQPPIDEMKKPFKEAYYSTLQRYPCFGHSTDMASKEWWKKLAADFLERTQLPYNDDQFERFFVRLFQHYGTHRAYEVIPDAAELLKWLHQQRISGDKRYSLGVITNTDCRTVDSILPVLGLHDYFDWFLCCREVGVEKPECGIFDEAHRRAQFTVPGVKKEEMLHVGDNFTTDFCGARAAGMQALFLDRSNNALISGYQEWLKAPSYDGKSEEDIEAHTIVSLKEVILRLQLAT